MVSILIPVQKQEIFINWELSTDSVLTEKELSELEVLSLMLRNTPAKEQNADARQVLI